MFRNAVASLALAFALAPPASAFDISDMSEAEREAFHAEIREYLLENPEVIMQAIAVLEQRREQQAAQAEIAMIEDNRDEIYEDGVSYVGGNPNGDVTVVEFLDYRCGFCKRAFPAVEELIASDGNIRFIVKEFPILGEASVLGSRYALASKQVHGDEVYKQVHDELMLLRGNLDQRALARVSRDLDLDHGRIEEVMDSPSITATIERNRALGRRLQIQGTPSFIMGDNFVRGFIELDQMRAIVGAIRAERS